MRDLSGDGAGTIVGRGNFHDIDANQPGGPGLFFLRIPLAKLTE